MTGITTDVRWVLFVVVAVGLTFAGTSANAQTIIPAGDCDDFAPPPEASSPSPDLVDFMDNVFAGGVYEPPFLDFDEIPGEGNVGPNKLLGHTFADLGDDGCIVGATLCITLRATTGLGSPGVDNDHIQFVDTKNQTVLWSLRIESLVGSWAPGDVATVCLDLANLPPSAGDVTSILDEVNRDHALNVMIDDDTGADCMVLTVTSATLDVELTYESGTLTMDFLVGSDISVTWNTWLIVDRFAIPMWSSPLPPIPTIPLTVPFPNFPDLGVIGVLTTLDGPDGIICWDFDIVDTAPPF